MRILETFSRRISLSRRFVTLRVHRCRALTRRLSKRRQHFCPLDFQGRRQRSSATRRTRRGSRATVKSIRPGLPHASYCRELQIHAASDPSVISQLNSRRESNHESEDPSQGRRPAQRDLSQTCKHANQHFCNGQGSHYEGQDTDQSRRPDQRHLSATRKHANEHFCSGQGSNHESQDSDQSRCTDQRHLSATREHVNEHFCSGQGSNYESQDSDQSRRPDQRHLSATRKHANEVTPEGHQRTCSCPFAF